MKEIQTVMIDSQQCFVDIPETSVALGNFDGVHIGHQALIRETKKIAQKNHTTCSVVTFLPHPKTIIAKYCDYHNYITPISVKRDILQELGVDIIYIIDFTKEFSEISPKDFINQYIRKINASTVLIGEDYRYGHRGQGNASTLLEHSKQGEFDVIVVPPVIYKKQKVSSTIIRQCIREGNIEEANFLLGRPFQIRGTVIHGEKRGRILGFPTANLLLKERYLLPKFGVYSVEVLWNQQKIKGIMNIGIKPTFHKNESKCSVEVHLLDFDHNLYGEELQVDVRAFIRPEKKFVSKEDLCRQIEEDIQKTRMT